MGAPAPARGGAAALRKRAPGAAVGYLDRALAEDPPDAIRSELLFGLGRATSMLGDQRSAIRRLREALELTVDRRTRVEIVHVLFMELSVSRAGVRVIELLERELAELPEDESDLGVLLESDVDSAGFLSLPAKRAAEDHRRRFDDPRDRGMRANAAMNAALYEGTAEQAAELALSAIRAGRLLEEEGPDSPRVWVAGFALLYSHRLAEAATFADEWIREASRLGSLRAYPLASSLRARASHWLGELAEAEGHARAVIEGMPEAIGLGRGFLAEALPIRAGWRRPWWCWGRPSAPRWRSSGRSSCRRC